MHKPFFSFFAATLIWFLLTLIFFVTISKKLEISESAIELDAQTFGEISQVEKLPQKKSLAKKPQIDKSSDLKKGEPETAPHHHHFEENSKNLSKKTAAIFNPLPQIPDELRSEAFKSEAIARLYISSDGAVLKVELLKPCANPTLNKLLLKSLAKWRFAPSQTESTQDINVNFLVKS